MPNWIEGTMKVRGTKDNIVKFFTEGTNKYKFNYETCEMDLQPKDYISIREYDDGTEIDLGECYIEGTRRAFIDYCNAYLYDDEECIATADIRQAWSFEAEDFEALKEKWDLDFRLFGIECGMEFAQEVIAERGKEVVDNCIDYADFRWECPFPNMGG